MVIDLSETLTQSEFGEVVGISQQAVSDLVRRQVIAEGQPAHVWLKQYCFHLREMAAGRGTDNGLDLANERAGLAREQKIRIEMQNAVTRREFGPIEALEIGLADCLSRVASHLDTIPGKLKRRSDKLTVDDLDTVSQTLVEVRNQLAALDIDWFGDLQNEQDDDNALETARESGD